MQAADEVEAAQGVADELSVIVAAMRRRAVA
jgi:hypothetical protein